MRGAPPPCPIRYGLAAWRPKSFRFCWFLTFANNWGNVCFLNSWIYYISLFSVNSRADQKLCYISEWLPKSSGVSCACSMCSLQLPSAHASTTSRNHHTQSTRERKDYTMTIARSKPRACAHPWYMDLSSFFPMPSSLSTLLLFPLAIFPSALPIPLHLSHFLSELHIGCAYPIYAHPT